jgi:hypothetical protein
MLNREILKGIKPNARALRAHISCKPMAMAHGLGASRSLAKSLPPSTAFALLTLFSFYLIYVSRTLIAPVNKIQVGSLRPEVPWEWN